MITWFPLCTCLKKNDERPSLTEVDSEDRCVYCGHYAFYMNNRVSNYSKDNPIGFSILDKDNPPTFRAYEPKSQRKTEIRVTIHKTGELFDVFPTITKMCGEMNISRSCLYESLKKNGRYKQYLIETVQVEDQCTLS